MTNLHNNYGNKPIYQTEYSTSDGTENLQAAINTAWHIHNAMTYLRANIYFYWSLWFNYSSGGAIHFSDEVDYVVNPTYYAIKHYSKFTGAGWTVLGSTTNSSGLRITSFKNPAGNQLTIVVLNVLSNGIKVAIDINNFTPVASAIYRTSANERWVGRGEFNPSVALLCPRQSITTISLWNSITDCDAALAARHRLAADLGGAGDCYVNFADFAVLAEHWLEMNCGQSGNCDGADFTPTDGTVNVVDLAYFAGQWLMCNDPTNPNCAHNW
jgi:hypothetical protein